MTHDNFKLDTPPRLDDAPNDFERWVDAVEDITLPAGVGVGERNFDWLCDKYRDGYSPEKVAAILINEENP